MYSYVRFVPWTNPAVQAKGVSNILRNSLLFHPYKPAYHGTVDVIVRTSAYTSPSSSSFSSSSSSRFPSSSSSSSKFRRYPSASSDRPHQRSTILAKDPLRIVYGIHACSTVLLTRSRRIHKAYISITNDHDTNNVLLQQEILPLCEKMNVHIIRIDRRSLDELTNNAVHQGIVFETDLLSTLPVPDDIAKIILRQPRRSSPIQTMNHHPSVSVVPSYPPLLIAMDEITDPMNIGAILRSALLLGADGILISNRNTASIGLGSISKASAGALEIWSTKKRLFTTSNMLTTLETYRNQYEWNIIGTVAPSIPTERINTSPSAPIIPLSQLYSEVILRDQNNTNKNSTSSPSSHNGIILVLGNEGTGLRTKIQNICNILTYIPMYNPLTWDTTTTNTNGTGLSSLSNFAIVESFNVSTAAAILMYQLRLGIL